MLAFAGAAEDNETEEEDYPYLYLDNRELNCSILVVSYDLMFQKLGGEPVITVTYTEQQDEDAQTSDTDTQAQEVVLNIETKNVRRDLLAGNGNEVHPLLFIRLPGYFGQFPESAKLTVGENAFQSTDGTPSPAMALQFSQFERREIGVGFRSEKVTLLGNVLAKTEITIYMDFRHADFIKLWNNNSSFFLDDVPVTNRDGWGQWCATVPGRGEHVIRMRLNDFVFTEELSFRAVSRLEARMEQFDDLGRVRIGQGIANMLLSIPLIVAPAIAIPNFFAGFLSVGNGLGCMFLSTFLLYLHSDRFYNGGNGHDFDGGVAYEISHWTFS